MGSGEEGTPGKPSKPAASTQETPSTHSYPDWATPVQAYYGSGATPPSFFQSPVPSSPVPHPYLWGGQHLMPPYGTPLPYPALYAHGGIYAHPSMTPVPVTSATEAEGKASDDKARGLVKKSKGGTGNLGFTCGKSGDGGKAGSGSANEGISHSGESGSEDSSDASEDNENRHDVRRRAFDQMIVDGANAQLNNAAQYVSPTGESCLTGQGQTAAVPPATVPGKLAGPKTNLNIGMDLWNASAAGAVNVKAKSAAAGVSSMGVPTPIIAREGVPSDLWIQDERELKRQRRKQSNRESARRSRLRKQHCEGTPDKRGSCWDLKVQGLERESRDGAIQSSPETGCRNIEETIISLSNISGRYQTYDGVTRYCNHHSKAINELYLSFNLFHSHMNSSTVKRLQIKEVPVGI